MVNVSVVVVTVAMVTASVLLWLSCQCCYGYNVNVGMDTVLVLLWLLCQC